MVLTSLKVFAKAVHGTSTRALSREVQAYLGYDGIVYADQKRKKFLNQKIEALEVELSRLKELRDGKSGES